ncbi:translational GTPase TypA [Phycisphaerales bacterium AB-hyl4]|uniref:Large ribosomal subunit assembly factor BipA n=1 Tax=Natronomicrosphaera hydrolytica TaxID=3242702 RepID=A0ABV4U271_9BACT
MSADHLRNVAIIAHVDHGKTTLVDQLLYQSGMFRNEDLDKLAGGQHGLVMDSNDLERERGITILAKNCAVAYTTPDGEKYKINLIDTPGHADFGGEVERVLKMADGVLLVVDAFEGPMPQTRFVLGKALEHKLKPVVVVNKIDRPDARPDDVVNEVFDLLVELEADDESLDFPVIYASAKEGWASRDVDERGENMKVLYDAIIEQVPAPSPEEADATAPPQMLVTSLDYSDYVGRIAIGRVFAGTLKPGMQVTVIDRAGKHTQQRILKTLQFSGLGRVDVDHVVAGDICAIVGLDPIDIGNTIACAESPEALPVIEIDEPTLHMTFRVNDSPFAGREGQYVTSRQIAARLEKELRSNVALRVEQGETPEQFRVSGRGLMHIGVVIENMRREGFELAIGKPRVITKEVDGKTHEPVELLVVDCPSECQSSVMSLVGDRRAELLKMDAKAGTSGFAHMEFTIPARGLMGLRSRMLTATQGRAIMHHVLLRYEPLRGEIPGAERSQGVLISSEAGQVTAYALDALYDRGFFFVSPGDQVYEGQVIGEHNRENDLVVNAVKGKKLSNVRASGKDDAAQVRPARKMSLEACLEYIDEDELVEVTPESIRIRKKLIKESDRRRDQRRAKSLAEA